MKKPFRFGAAVGGVLGIVIAVSMDALLGQGPGGGWGPAVAHDLNILFKTDLSVRNPLVVIGVILIVALFGAIGALAGGVFTAAIFRFFRLLTGED
jgi:hypothetical protein